MNNREATIISGNSISIPVTSDGKIEIETVDTGISIKATPHVIEKDTDKTKDIMLDITIESSSLGDSIGGNINKNTNKINTNVIMKNNQTLILGGLFQYTQSNTDGGVPLLKDIPLIGFLFSTKSKLLNKSELVFFITPQIITDDMIVSMQNSNKMHYLNSLDEQKEMFLKQQNVDKSQVKQKRIKIKKDKKSEHEEYINKMFGLN
jgi:type II secretory pathway component GspD/PulD (secretin)